MLNLLKLIFFTSLIFLAGCEPLLEQKIEQQNGWLQEKNEKIKELEHKLEQANLIANPIYAQIKKEELKLEDIRQRLEAKEKIMRDEATVAAACKYLFDICPNSMTQHGFEYLKGGIPPRGDSRLWWLVVVSKVISVVLIIYICLLILNFGIKPLFIKKREELAELSNLREQYQAIQENHKKEMFAAEIEYKNKLADFDKTKNKLITQEREHKNIINNYGIEINELEQVKYELKQEIENLESDKSALNETLKSLESLLRKPKK